MRTSIFIVILLFSVISISFTEGEFTTNGIIVYREFVKVFTESEYDCYNFRAAIEPVE